MTKRCDVKGCSKEATYSNLCTISDSVNGDVCREHERKLLKMYRDFFNTNG